MKENVDDQRVKDNDCVSEQSKVLEMIKQTLDSTTKTAELGVHVDHLERRVGVLERDYHKTAIAISNMESNLKIATDIIPRIEPILDQLHKIVTQKTKLEALAIKSSFWISGVTIAAMFLAFVMSVVSSENFGKILDIILHH